MRRLYVIVVVLAVCVTVNLCGCASPLQHKGQQLQKIIEDGHYKTYEDFCTLLGAPDKITRLERVFVAEWRETAQFATGSSNAGQYYGSGRFTSRQEGFEFICTFDKETGTLLKWHCGRW